MCLQQPIIDIADQNWCLCKEELLASPDCGNAQRFQSGQLSGTDEQCEVKDHRHMTQDEPATLDKGPLCSENKQRLSVRMTDSQPTEELQDFPAHLIDLYRRASEGRLNDERSLIQDVLRGLSGHFLQE